jgi:phosphate starvation-inducible protein PhoH and related proteins
MSRRANSKQNPNNSNNHLHPKPIRKEISFEPRTENQKKLINEIKHNTIVIATGPAGTGKTLVSVAIAAQMLLDKEIEQIVITRPVIEAAEESMGYLPGDLNDKIAPYLIPLKDSLGKFFGRELVESLFLNKIIDVVPLAYMRGRSLENSIIICDEIQNATYEGIHMLLTRVGKNSKLILNGDLSQIDLRPRERSGLSKVINALRGVESISFVEFQISDIQRHPVVGHVVKALEKYERNENINLISEIGILPKKIQTLDYITLE